LLELIGRQCMAEFSCLVRAFSRKGNDGGC
jgi:hypothetical protein